VDLCVLSVLPISDFSVESKVKNTHHDHDTICSWRIIFTQWRFSEIKKI